MGAPGFGAAEGAAIPGSMTDGAKPLLVLVSLKTTNADFTIDEV
jgi:hypothetical protein